MCIYSQNTIKKHLHIFHNRLYSIQSINRTVIVRHSKHNATIQKLNIIEKHPQLLQSIHLRIKLLSHFR